LQGVTTTHALIAGVLASLVGLFVFLVIHHFWIKPIWFITLPGMLIAAVGGVAFGWAYSELALRRPLSSLALCGIMLAILTPSALLSLTHGPLFDLATATIPPGQGRRVAAHFICELILPSIIAGALVGWAVGRSLRASIAMSVAALAFAIGPGHNIPMFGTNPRAFKGFALMIAIVVSSCISLVHVNAWLQRRPA
jgi:hypothetical protein